MNGVHVLNEYRDGRTAKSYGTMTAERVSGDALYGFLDQNLTSSFILTQAWYPRLENGDIVDGLFGFQLYSFGRGVNYRTGQGFAGGVDYRPEFDWSLDGQRVEFAVCYWTFEQLGIAGDNRCYYQIRRIWHILDATETEPCFRGPARRGGH